MILDLFNLQGKVAMVTGCNTGLGQAMALGLAEAGCATVGVNRSNPEQTAAKMQAGLHQFLDLRVDLANQTQIPHLIEAALAKYGRIDILVNNAGIIRRADAIDFTAQDWDDVMNVNNTNHSK